MYLPLAAGQNCPSKGSLLWSRRSIFQVNWVGSKDLRCLVGSGSLECMSSTHTILSLSIPSTSGSFLSCKSSVKHKTII